MLPSAVHVVIHHARHLEGKVLVTVRTHTLTADALTADSCGEDDSVISCSSWGSLPAGSSLSTACSAPCVCSPACYIPVFVGVFQ